MPTELPTVTKAELEKAVALAHKPNKTEEDLEASRKYLNELAKKYKLPAHTHGDWGLDKDGRFR